jgi:hypothetical protein
VVCVRCAREAYAKDNVDHGWGVHAMDGHTGRPWSIPHSRGPSLTPAVQPPSVHMYVFRTYVRNSYATTKKDHLNVCSTGLVGYLSSHWLSNLVPGFGTPTQEEVASRYDSL